MPNFLLKEDGDNLLKEDGDDLLLEIPGSVKSLLAFWMGGGAVPSTASGPANLKIADGLVKASVKTFNGLALVSVKTVHVLA